MARPTTAIVRAVPTPEEERDTALGTVHERTAASAEALVEGLALLQSLHERGVLEALVALVQHGDDVLGTVMETLAQGSGDNGYTRGAKNAITLAQGFGALDEATVATTQRMVTGGLRAFASAEPPTKPLGVFDLLRALKDPDVSAGLSAVLALLKGIGVAQRERDKE